MGHARRGAAARRWGLAGACLAVACAAPIPSDRAEAAPRRPTPFAPIRVAGVHPSIPSAPSRAGGTGPSVFGGTAKLSYFGGRILSNVVVVAVDWTSAVDPAISSVLPGFYADVTGGPYFRWLAEYSTTGLTGAGDGLPGSNQVLGPGTFDDTYVITPSNSSTTLDDTDIRAELAAQLDAGTLPAPLLDAAGNVDSLYAFDFPPGYTITLGSLTSCANFCGYHGTLLYGASSLSVPYTVVMDLGPASACSSGCGGASSYVDNSTSVHSHELVEAATDTEAGLGLSASGRPLAWYDDTDMPGGEAGDLCNAIQATLDGYTVQEIWSNANGACIAVAPPCDGTLAPPSCTPCTDPDAPPCTTASPVCDSDRKSARYGQCVGCMTRADCGPPTTFCDVTTQSCRGCTPADCAGTRKPVCETSGPQNGSCVECDGVDDSACRGATPACATLSFTCVGCVEDSGCSGDAPICDGPTETCRACRSSTECSPGVCETPSGACVACLTDADCGSESCDARSHTCRCKADSECSNPAPICGGEGRCTVCRRDADCAGAPGGPVCMRGSCARSSVDGGRPQDGAVAADAEAGLTDSGVRSPQRDRPAGCALAPSDSTNASSCWAAAALVAGCACARRKRRRRRPRRRPCAGSIDRRRFEGAEPRAEVR